MPRPKGQSKLGGRVKGTPNAMTRENKELISEVLAAMHGELPAKIAQLEPAEYVNAYIKLMEFVCPKPQRIELNATTLHHVTIEETLLQLSQEQDI